MEGFKYLRAKRQDVYDINKFTLNDFSFEGNEKKVYQNCNLSIFVDDYCNANCKFCVAQLRYENRSKMYCKKRIASDEEYFKRLEYVLNYIKPLNVSVSITGGEPTKSNRLYRILEIIDKCGMRKRTITTNGSGLFDEYNGKNLLQHLIDNHFQYLNISRAHYDEDKNQSIMDFEKDTCSNEMLSKIIPYAKEHNLRPRLSCLLLRDGIHDVKDMTDYMNFYEQYGIDNVIFRQLMDYDEGKMINKEKMNYCAKNKVDLNDIWMQIDDDKQFIPNKNILGYYYYVEIYKYHNIDMCSESADIKKLYVEKEKHKDNVYEMVFHPNGNLNGSWVDNEDILLEYKRYVD
jgi:molybdenum cofactor biosynthesis enzyme MoaA